MKTIKVIGNCCLVFLSIIAVCVSLVYLYYHFFVSELTVGVNYISDQIGLDIVNSEDLTDEEIDEYEERYFLEGNLYSNSKGNGIQLEELKFYYFTNYSLTSSYYRETGMQYIGDYVHSDVTVSSTSELNNYVFPQFYYYDTTDGISYSGYYGNNASVSVALKRSTTFIVKIGGEPYLIKLDKSYSTGWWLWKKTHYYTWSELFQSCMTAIKSNSAGYGDYYITLDLFDYFSVYAYNSNNGNFEGDDVSDVIKNYSVFKFHYDENGALNSTQSLFGIIECNSIYDISDTDVDTTYWQERVIYNLTETTQYLGENIFDFRYSEIYGGYFISLTMDAKKLFASMPRTIVYITINLQSDYLVSNNINIVGIDYNGFEDCEINTLTFIGDPQTLYLLDSALTGTNLEILQYSDGITFDYSDTATDNEFAEVIV